MQPNRFNDPNGFPLPGGMAIKFPTIFDHEAIIAYDYWSGEQMLLEKSKKHKRPTYTSPEEYRGIPFIISRVATSPEHAARIVQHASAEIESGGTPWTPFDNCQDFVNRAYKGQNGSPTRDLAIGLAACGLLFTAVMSSR